MANNDGAPDLWGDDPLSEHIAASCNNARVSFGLRSEQVALARGVDAVYREATSHATELSETKEWFAPLLLHGSHASYLASVQMALAGQLPQSFMLQRGALEYAIYGFYLASDEARQTTWLSRHKSEEHRKAVTQEFRPGRFLDLLAKRDGSIGAKAKKLYDHAIDLGAHPNSRAVLQAVTEERTETVRRFNIDYFVLEHPFFENCLRTAVEVGITSLRVFGLLWPSRFDGWGMFKELDRLEETCCGAKEA